MVNVVELEKRVVALETVAKTADGRDVSRVDHEELVALKAMVQALRDELEMMKEAWAGRLEKLDKVTAAMAKAKKVKAGD